MGHRVATHLPVAAAVSANLAKLREWHGLSLRELADRTERAGHRINYHALNEIEHGSNRHGVPRAVTVDQAVVLARVFKIGLGELLRPGLEPTVAPIRAASASRPQNGRETGQNRP